MFKPVLPFVFTINSYDLKSLLQSETEKLISKQLRKDEKRIQREQNKASEETDAVLNIQKLKQMRLVCRVHKITAYT